MTKVYYHLAQVNIARMRAPLADPVMAGFVSKLEEVNAIAESAPGFVWRLQNYEEGDATSFRMFDDPMLLVNMSVWESPDALHAYVYQSGHLKVLRQRKDWFEPVNMAHLALWWIPAGHRPTVAQAQQRLEYVHRKGATPAAFHFREMFVAPEAPQTNCDSLCSVNFGGRTFVTSENSSNGDADQRTRFHYQQDGSRVWATYEGGHIKFGTLVGAVDDQGGLDVRYQHVNDGDGWRTGRCSSRAELLAEGSLRLHESWQWTNSDLSQGHSVLEEIVL